MFVRGLEHKYNQSVFFVVWILLKPDVLHLFNAGRCWRVQNNKTWLFAKCVFLFLIFDVDKTCTVVADTCLFNNCR